MRGSLVEILRNAWRSPSGRWGALTLLVVSLLALAGPLVVQDPAAMPNVMAGAEAPSWAHPLGTDPLSRDILARTIHGARVSLGIAALAVALAILLGTSIGATSGYLGGWVDAAIMRTVDAGLAVPRLIVLLLLVLVWERIPTLALALVIGSTGWLGTCRMVRGEVLRLREMEFIRAARALGASRRRIIARHLVPNAAGPIAVSATLGVADVILLEAGLSFLGMGVQPPTPSWGGMILDARPVLLSAPWTSLAPGIAILVTVLAVNLVGDALQRALDPRSA
ncbi:MAG: ABC transporter permease [Gemmatimonadales bacterium]|nr:ABC transporter permease [Gemmatimonadales bacterium]